MYVHIRLKHSKEDHFTKSQENLKFSQETECNSCKEMINHRNLKKHLKACEIYGQFFKKDQNNLNCNLCPYNTSARSEMHRHIRIKHRDEIPNNEGNIQSISDQKNCLYCLEMVNENDRNKHNELCLEASKYMSEEMCLICDIEFHTSVEALNHIKKEHIDLIEITEEPSEVIPRPLVKDKVKTDIKEDVFDKEYFNENMNSQDEKFCSDDFNVKRNIQDRPEPVEITTIFKCSMCFKKYLSASDVETHISSFHRIPIEIRKQGCIPTKIIEEIL
jgi:hypothetical protein